MYGITKCFRTDAPDGPCLREHTTLPDDTRVLLGKGPASKGELSFFFQGLHTVETQEGCTYGYLSANGTPFSSIVVAAYNASGHAIFEIVDGGRYTSNACGIGTDD